MNYYYFILPLLFIIFLSLFINNNDNKCDKDEIITKLTRQTARWAIAAQQDKSPMIAILHMQYSVGYWWALKDIFSTEDIARVTGIDVEQFEKKLLDAQDNITRNLVKVCPQFAGDIDRYLGRIAGDI